MSKNKPAILCIVFAFHSKIPKGKQIAGLKMTTTQITKAASYK